MKITVTGAAFEAALNPLITDVPREEGWPSPTVRKVGYGRQYVYDVTAEQADLISDHLADVGESFLHSDDEFTRREGRACLAAAVRIRAQVAG